MKSHHFKFAEEVATKVGENLEFVKRLVSWCHVDDHPGVKGKYNVI